jgi:hypothetical protein
MEKIVQKQLEAYNKRDLETFCECYHPNIFVTRLSQNQVICTDKTQFREVYKKLFEASPNLHCEIKSRIIMPSVVIDEELITGRAGTADDFRVVSIYAFKDGLIERVWFAY